MTELKLNLGCGRHLMDGWVNIDQTPGEGVKVINLDREKVWLPYNTDSVDEFYSSHMIEHITHTLPLMQELWRVAKPGALATFLCPYGSSDDAWENPTHVRPMFVGSWAFFGQPNYWREDYGYTADWKIEEIRLRVSEETWNRDFDGERDQGQVLMLLWDRVQHEHNIVKEMVAVLSAVKPARAADRELQENRTIVIEVRKQINPWENRAYEVGRLTIGLPK